MKDIFFTTGICLLLIATGLLINWSGQSDGQYLITFINTLIPLAAAFIGAYYASHLMTKREKALAEKNKMDIANKWILMAEQARSNLISIKSTYQKGLEDQPLQRTVSIPPIILSVDPFKEEYSKLSFILPKKDDKDPSPWSQITRIRAMFENFNFLLTLWEKRNEQILSARHKLSEVSEAGLARTFSLKELIDCIGEGPALVLIDFTEQAIHLTDDILVELNSFIHSFPAYANEIIDKDKTKPYGSVITFHDDQEGLIKSMIVRSPTLNHSAMAATFKLTPDEIQARYFYGYKR
jgi:hypothetical protein